jgi:exopolysaccharide biosynthesis polyprenyl glycosylphosphotransferase
VLGKMQDLRSLAETHGIQEVFIATPAIQMGEMRKLINACRMAEISYRFVPNLLDEPLHRAVMYTVGNVPFIKTEEPKINIFTSFMKRSIDLLLSSMILLIMSPILALIALLIKRDSAGPIFFKQVRIGQNGKPFTMYKFRTMHLDAPVYTYSPTSLQDERITRIGKYLRRTSLDEIPQFFNVLKNDMSIVGPRPEMPFIVEQYNELQRERLLVKPGITGLWQITLDRSKLIHENLDYDFYYIKNISVLLDILIIIKTIWFALRGVAAY